MSQMFQERRFTLIELEACQTKSGGAKLVSARRRRQAMAAFTLIELLVVVAVIMILASLLLPALSQAKRVSYKAVCISNLKQTTMAGISYYEENDQILPTYGARGTEWNWSSLYHDISSTTWMTKIYEQVQGEGVPQNQFETGEILAPFQACPQFQADVNNPDYWDNRYYNFGLNYWLGGYSRESRAGRPAPPNIPKSRHLLERKFWFCDTAGRYGALQGNTTYFYPITKCDLYQGVWYDRYLPAAWEWQDESGNVPEAYRRGHPSNKSNFAFGDGHVEAYNYKELAARYPSSSALVEFICEEE